MTLTVKPSISAAALLVCSIAAWMSFGRLHYLMNADSVLPVLVSLQHWTPFYWGQDRFGMLAPLLAMPVHNPLANLLVQGWLTTVAALLAPFLVARYFGAGPYWFAAGALANVFLLLMVSPLFQFAWFVMQPYGLSITLAVAGLLVVDGTGAGRKAAAVTLMLLAHWVNLGVFVVIVPSILVRARSRTLSLSMTAFGVAGGILFQHLSAAPATTTAILPAAAWPHGWIQLLRTTSSTIVHPAWSAVIIALAAIGAMVLLINAPSSEPAKAAAMAVIVACAHWLIIGTFKHVQLNDYFPRYALPSLLLLGVAMAIVLVASVGRNPRVAATITSLALVAASVGGYGVPSLSRLRRSMDRRIGMMTAGIIDAGATVIVGDYWTVWPAVFHVDLALYEHTGQTPVYGLTFRSDTTDLLWSSGVEGKRVVLAALRWDESVNFFINRVGVPVTFLEYRGPLVLFVTGTGSN